MDVILEKINVSDDSYILNELSVDNGAYVEEGDTIFCIETSKVSIEFPAPVEGYIYFERGLTEGMELPVGFLIAKIVKESVNPFDMEQETSVVEEKADMLLTEIPVKETEQVITEGAWEVIDKYHINVSLLAGRSFVCKADVCRLLKDNDLMNTGYGNGSKKIAIIGAGAGAVQVMDLIRSLKGYSPVLIFDDTEEKQGKNLDGVPVLGKVDFLKIKELYSEGIFDYVINSVSTSISFRKRCFDELSVLNVPYCNLIHPTAVIGYNVKLGSGNIIFPHIHIGADTEIGNDNFITAKASIEHHNQLGNHCTFGPGVMTSGHVCIGDETRFGTGIFIEPFVKIGKNCLIASGSILCVSVPDNSVVRHNSDIEIVKKRMN